MSSNGSRTIKHSEINSNLNSEINTLNNNLNNSLNNFIKSATVSGTTSSNGNITLDKTPDEIILLFATAGIQTICTIGVGSSGSYTINVKDTAGNNKTQKDVSVTYFYIKRKIS